jgi:hypothetical protein
VNLSLGNGNSVVGGMDFTNGNWGMNGSFGNWRFGVGSDTGSISTGVGFLDPNFELRFGTQPRGGLTGFIGLTYRYKGW